MFQSVKGYKAVSKSLGLQRTTVRARSGTFGTFAQHCTCVGFDVLDIPHLHCVILGRCCCASRETLLMLFFPAFGWDVDGGLRVSHRTRYHLPSHWYPEIQRTHSSMHISTHTFVKCLTFLSVILLFSLFAFTITHTGYFKPLSLPFAFLPASTSNVFTPSQHHYPPSKKIIHYFFYISFSLPNPIFLCGCLACSIRLCVK